jgi:pyruvate dehydrogenase E2 component (dihydrolipoamide acetyltransferase)
VSTKGEVRIQEPTPAERTVARRAAESRATVPEVELSVSLTSSDLRTSALIQACGLALQSHPRANAAYRDGHFELYSRINVGFVVAGADAYLIPTVFDADQKTLKELDAEIKRLAAAAAAGELTSPSLSGATFTVWNAAAHGLSAASIPVVPPQACALAAGTETLTLACDHRILYGAGAAAFLGEIRERLGSQAG